MRVLCICTIVSQLINNNYHLIYWNCHIIVCYKEITVFGSLIFFWYLCLIHITFRAGPIWTGESRVIICNTHTHGNYLLIYTYISARLPLLPYCDCDSNELLTDKLIVSRNIKERNRERELLTK